MLNHSAAVALEPSRCTENRAMRKTIQPGTCRTPHKRELHIKRNFAYYPQAEELLSGVSLLSLAHNAKNCELSAISYNKALGQYRFNTIANINRNQPQSTAIQQKQQINYWLGRNTKAKREMNKANNTIRTRTAFRRSCSEPKGGAAPKPFAQEFMTTIKNRLSAVVRMPNSRRSTQNLDQLAACSSLSLNKTTPQQPFWNRYDLTTRSTLILCQERVNSLHVNSCNEQIEQIEHNQQKQITKRDLTYEFHVDALRAQHEYRALGRPSRRDFAS